MMLFSTEGRMHLSVQQRHFWQVALRSGKKSREVPFLLVARVARGRHVARRLTLPVMYEDPLGGGVPRDVHVRRPIQRPWARER